MFETTFTKNEESKTLVVEREFAASRDRVWHAWTDQSILEQWWAPKPWKAVTKSFEFREGGKWLYAMTGPEGEKHWAVMEYVSVNPKDNFTAKDAFTDENGNIDEKLPRMEWQTEFSESNGTTKVKITTTFSDVESLNKVIEMGVQEGTAMSHQNLDELLASGQV